MTFKERAVVAPINNIKGTHVTLRRGLSYGQVIHIDLVHLKPLISPLPPVVPPKLPSFSVPPMNFEKKMTRRNVSGK